MIIAIIITLCIFLFDFYFYITKNNRAEEKSNQMRTTKTSAAMIRETINSDLNTIYAISSILSTYESIDNADARALLKKVGNEFPFSLLLVDSLDGNYYTNNNGYINISQPDYLVGTTGGHKKISVIYKDALYNKDMIALSSPIYQQGKIVGVVSGLYYTNYLMRILESASDDNELEYQIIERNGDFILSSEMSVFRDYNNIYRFLDDVTFYKGESKDDLVHAFLQGKSAIAYYQLRDKDDYLCIMPIGINNWSLVTSEPIDGINLQIASIKNPTVLLAVRIIILFIVLFLYIIWRQIRYRSAMIKSNNDLETLNERLKLKNEILKLKAENDLLTGLYNKITSELMISDFLKNDGREGRHALLVIDIDNFKNINDEMGHLYGDKALVEVANGISRSLRTTDIKGRIGGDEFIILMKNIHSNDDLNAKANEICHLLHEVTLSEEFLLKFSASIGVSIYPDHAKSYTDLFLKADKAMYHSKEQGKGVYVIYSDDLENR